MPWMDVLSYLVLQGCISFCSVSEKDLKSGISVFALFASNAIAQVFQDICHSNKQNASVSWNPALSCPLMASDFASLYLVLISFRSRSGADHSLDFLGWKFPNSFYRSASRFKVFQTKVAHFFGDKFGESLGGTQAPASFWEVPGLPRKFPELPRKLFGDFPEVLSLWNLTIIRGSPEVSQTSPEVPQTSPEVPGLPRRSAPLSGKPDTLS